MTIQNSGTNPTSVAAAPVREAAAVVEEVATVGVRANAMIMSKNVMKRLVILLLVSPILTSTSLMPYHRKRGKRGEHDSFLDVKKTSHFFSTTS